MSLKTDHIGTDTHTHCLHCGHHHCLRCGKCHRCGCETYVVNPTEKRNLRLKKFPTQIFVTIVLLLIPILLASCAYTSGTIEFGSGVKIPKILIIVLVFIGIAYYLKHKEK